MSNFPNWPSFSFFHLQSSVNDTYRVISVTNDTSVDDVMVTALSEFGLDHTDLNRYRLVEVSLEKGGELIHSRTVQFAEQNSFFLL